MFTFTRHRKVVFAVLVTSIAIVTMVKPPELSSQVKSTSVEVLSESSGVQSGSLTRNATFYIARPDLRKCASPLCGGYFVRRVNYNLTRCANGRYMSECYVASIDWNGANEVEINRVLLGGSIVTTGNRNGRFGVLRVAEVWRSADDDKPYGDFFRVRDLGLRCIAAPCPSHQEAKLNTAFDRKIAGVDIHSATDNEQILREAQKAMTSPNGIIVAGGHSPVTGPAGRSEMLKASQFYLRNNNTVGMKPCIKTGCSGQICSDQDVVTTCEYRREYDCYKKAACERQSNGDCGFTMTRELRSCLARN